MKNLTVKLISALMLFLFVMTAQAQIVVYDEDFETPPFDVTATGNPLWSVNTTLYNSGTQSYHNEIAQGDTSFLTTASFSTAGNTFVLLEFAHIAKVAIFDGAYIEVSVDNGVNWTRLTGNEYLGTGQFGTLGNRFVAASYPTLWVANDDLAVPDNTWWRQESFDISAIAGDEADVQIRFVLYDGGNPPGSGGNYGWLIDDITVSVIPELHDLAVDSIISPVGDFCYSGNEPVTIQIGNYGLDTIFGGFEAAYTVDGGTPVTEIVGATIAPNEQTIYTFTTPIDFTLPGADSTFILKTYVSVASDPYTHNDTLETEVKFLYIPPSPVAINDTVAYGTSATLEVLSPYSVNWYATPSLADDNVLDTGTVFTTPVLYGNTSYYASAGSGMGLIQVGPVDPSIGTSGSFASAAQYKLFDVLANSVNIHSVDMYPTVGPGAPYTIVIQDASQQTIFSHSGVTTVAANTPETIILDAVIPQGTGYRFGFADAASNPGVLRNSNGAVHPYTAPNLFSITGNTFGPEYYYFFYNIHIGSGASCESPRTEVWAVVTGNPPVDAGVVSIDEPVSPTNLDPQDLIVSIQNFGTDPLTSVDIHWTHNGAPQAPFSWTGNLQLSETDSVNIATFTPVMGNNHIVAWTVDPNGVTDPMPLNDTTHALIVAFEPMCGTYIIGSSAAANFATFDDAVYAMEFNGITCPVVFEVEAGTYNERIELNGSIPGISATNTVTFTGEPGAVIYHSPTVTGERAAIALMGASHYRFDNLHIELDPTADWGWGIYIGNNSEDIEITNSYIETHHSTTIANYNAIVASGSPTSPTSLGSGINDIRIENNTIVGGYYGVIFYGSSGSNINNAHVINNHFIDQFYYGVRFYYVVEPVATHNIFDMFATGNINARAIDVNLSTGPFNFSYNEIYNAALYGIYVASTNASAGQPSQIVNNAIGGGFRSTSTAASGIYITSSSHVDVLYNSVYCDANQGRTFYTLATADELNIQNNSFVFSGSGSGYAMYISSTSGINALDHNNYYSGNSSNFVYYGANRSNISALQAVNIPPGNDQNSVSGDPVYTAVDYLYPLGTTLHEAGTPITGITDDIEGNPRDPVNPDIGAYEFTPVAADISLDEAKLTRGLCLSSNDSVYMTIKNIIGAAVDFSVDPLTAVWEVSGPVNSSGTIVINTGVLAPLAELEFGGSGVDMSVPGTYTLDAYIEPNAANNFLNNDTIWSAFVIDVPADEFDAQPDSVLITNSTDTVELTVSSNLFPGGGFIITEICHYRLSSTGNPVGGWPSYLIADDYIEITGAPNSDLDGYTLEQWSTTALISSHTFPSGTVMSPNGTAIIAVGQMGSSVPSPSDFYYHGDGGVNHTFSSTTVAGRILKDPNGDIVDAVGYGTYTFPAAAGVTPADWSGNTPAVSSAGNRLEGPYTKDATNWINSGVSPQTPNSVNPGVDIPTADSISDFTWSLDGIVTSHNNPDTVVGPFNVNGLYQYVATYNSPCGVFTDTVNIHVFIPDYEAGILEILHPFDNACSFDNTEYVNITIRNNGVEDITSNLTASYTVNGGPPVTEAITTPIVVGDTLDFVFSTPITLNLSSGEDTTLLIVAYIDHPDDPFTHNDTIIGEFTIFFGPEPPVTINDTIPYGGFATLIASSPGGKILWYDDFYSQNFFDTGDTLFVGPFYSNQTYYAAATDTASGGIGAVPELLYYDFNTPGTSVPNLASSPVGDNPATITGTGLSIGGTGLSGTALVGTGQSSSTNAINTNWATNLSGSFTISFWTSDIPPSSTLYYIFGDNDAGGFRCFTNGAAGSDNWLVRGGGLPDLAINGAATMNPNMVHAVYDAPAGEYRAYIDGVLVNTVTAPTTNTMSGTNFKVGGYSTNTGLNGLMDEFRIYNRALTEQEIQNSLGMVGGGCVTARIPATAYVIHPQYEVAAIAITEPTVDDDCMSDTQYVSMLIANYGTDTIDSNLSASYIVNNNPPVTETVTTVIAPGDTIEHNFSTPMTFPGGGAITLHLTAFVDHPGDNYALNDTVKDTIDVVIMPPPPIAVNDTVAYGSQAHLEAISNVSINWYATNNPLDTIPLDTGAVYTTPILYGNTSYYASAMVGTGGGFIITEICHFKTSTGQPVGGWPPYLLADDYIEITGSPGSDLSGYSLEMWTATALNNSQTLAPGTVLSPDGTAIIATGQLASSVPSPANYYYHSGNTSSIGSQTPQGYILKDPSGTIVDAVGYPGNSSYTFPTSAGVDPSLFSLTWAPGNAQSTSGTRLIGDYTGDDSNWVVSSALHPQDPNDVNPGVDPPTVGCESNRVEVIAVVTGQPPVDAGLEAIIEPVSPTDLQPQDVTVIIKNYGTDPLTSVNINWTHNGATQSAMPWTGNLPTNGADTVTIGSFTPTIGNNYLQAWVSDPNGVVDPMPYNDSASAVILAFDALCGIYNVGGPNAHFNDFDVISHALNNYGVSCAVTFVVHPGIYNEGIHLDDVPGYSAANSIRFVGLPGSELRYTPSANRAAISLENIGYVSIDSMTVIIDPNAGQGWGIYMGNHTHDIEITNNHIETNTSTTIADFNVIVASGSPTSPTGLGTGINNILVENNTLVGGYYGVIFYGSSGSNINNAHVINNHFIDQFYYGVRYYYVVEPVATHNIFDMSATGNASGRAIHVATCTGPFNFSYNEIYNAGLYGIYVASTNATAGQPSQIVNNAIGGGFRSTSTGASGIYITSTSHVDILYNSVNCDANQGRTFYTLTTANGLNIKNNSFVFSGSGSGYAMYISSTSGINALDYNNYYSGNSSNFVYYGANRLNLTALQAVNIPAGNDQNSVSGDPLYYGIYDLMPVGAVLNDAGTPIAGITDDITGAPRDPSTPDIGAYEFTPPQIDIAVLEILNLDNYVNGGSSFAPEVVITNWGSNTITTIPMHYTVNGGTPVAETWTGTLASYQTDTVVFSTSFTIPNGPFTLCVYSAVPGDANLNNDTICESAFGIPLIGVPYSNDFESTVHFYTMGTTNQWERGEPTASVINNAHSPVNVWATNLSGDYDSNSNYNLMTPRFSFINTTNALLSFWYWIDSQLDTDGGRIQYSTNNGLTWSTLGTVGDPLATNWYNSSNINGAPAFSGHSGGWVNATYDLSQFDNYPTPVQFRFNFFSDASINHNGFAIDDFEIIRDAIPEDAGVIAILSPGAQSVTGTVEDVEVVIENFGTDTLFTIPIRYRVNTNVPVQETWTGVLPPGETANYTFNTTLSETSSYDLCAYTRVLNDIYTFNDTTCIFVEIIPAQYDAGVIEIILPDSTSIALEPVNVSARIKNFGTETLTSFDVAYDINAGGQTVETWTGTLAPDQEVVFDFTATYISLMGNYILCVETQLSNDQNMGNNRLCKTITGTTNIDELAARELFTLEQNIPNPAELYTTIGFNIPRDGQVVFKVTNVLGQTVYEESASRSAGRHTVVLQTGTMPKGLYYYSVEYENRRLVKRMVIH